MPKFEYDPNISPGDLANRKLGDELSTEIASIGVKESHKVKSRDFSYELGSNLSFKVELFNSDSDQDNAHKVLGKVRKKTGAEGVGWQPVIDRGGRDAWLKYTTSAGIKPGAQVDFGPVLGIKANGIVDHFYYHRHPRTRLLGTAVARDMAAQKNVFSVEDVLALGVDEALGIAAGGHLQITLKISWSDILASGATALAGLVNSSEAVGFKLPADARASLNLVLDDDFKLVFLGLYDGKIRVALRKSKSATFKAGVTVGIKAGLSKPAEVSKVLNAVLAGLLGISLDDYRNTVASLQKHADLKSLSSPQREIASLMLERVGLDDEITRTKELLNKLSELEKIASREINSIAANKAKMSFAYEYSRIETDASILEADFTAPAVRRLYPDLLAGRFQVLLSDSENFPDQIEIRRFLNQESLVISQAIGLSLGIGKWTISGKENTAFKFISQVNAKDAVRHALLGSRKYTGKWFGSEWSTFLEFKADMEDFKPAGVTASPDDFSLGLSLNYTESPSRTRKTDIRNIVDTALLWGAGPEGDFDRLVSELAHTIPGNSATQSIVLLTLGNSEVRDFSRWIAVRPVREIADAFAAAMPGWEHYPQTLEIRYRRQIYQQIWEKWILDPFTTAGEASAFAYTVLRRYNTSLANEERKARKTGNTAGHTIYRSFRLNSGQLQDFRRTRDAFARLNPAMKSRESYKKLPPIVRGIHGFANTRFKIRVMGALIMAYRRSPQASPGDIAASLRIKYNRENGKFKDVYVISHKN